ncbi:MAG: hypothetical protein M3R17_16085 [Bacteroidota bacterium]|nr:hypothetical protein [Bacteroidota bacterium]
MTNYQLPERGPDSLIENELVHFLLPDALILLENDFITSGMELKISGKIFGDVFDLRELLAKELVKTGGPASEQFYRLLYRADIPETKLKELLQEGPGEPFEIRVAELLIVRALQKAFFRKKYK